MIPVYEEMYPKGRVDCENCFPGIHENNEDIITIFDNCLDQVVSIGQTPHSLDIQAVDFVINKLRDKLELDPEFDMDLNQEVRHFAKEVFGIQRKHMEDELVRQQKNGAK